MSTEKSAAEKALDAAYLMDMMVRCGRRGRISREAWEYEKRLLTVEWGVVRPGVLRLGETGHEIHVDASRIQEGRYELVVFWGGRKVASKYRLADAKTEACEHAAELMDVGMLSGTEGVDPPLGWMGQPPKGDKAPGVVRDPVKERAEDQRIWDRVVAYAVIALLTNVVCHSIGIAVGGPWWGTVLTGVVALILSVVLCKAWAAFQEGGKA